MKIGEIYNAKIEKITNLGHGLARIDGAVVFVENVCTGDEVEIKITKLNKNFANASIITLINPSPFRVTPFCPMQKVCGACQIQFIDYDYQLELKQQIVKEIMHSIGNLDIEIPKTIPSPNRTCYRHKIQYPISQTKNSKRILAGYYKPSSHEIINIKYCPIQPEICDKIIEYVRENAPEYSINAYNERTKNGLLRHIQIRHSEYNKKCLVTLVINDNNTNKIAEFAKKLYNNFEEISGVSVNFNRKSTNVILGNKTECIIGDAFINEKICSKVFKIGPETFFQVNPLSAQNIFNYIKDFITNNYNSPTILDAYAGMSVIGICLSDIAKNVVTIEENLKSVELAKECVIENNVKNIEIYGGDAQEFFKNETRKFDVIILDPPRKGCTKESLDNALKLCNGHIVYVSCNPATLARDLKYLKDKNCKIELIQPFDMFCHTYHIENVAILKV